jgi:hypothetical protein
MEIYIFGRFHVLAGTEGEASEALDPVFEVTRTEPMA